MLSATRFAAVDPRAGRRWLWLIVTLGTAVRLGVAFGDPHGSNDISALADVARAMQYDPLHVYSIVGPVHWPYPPGYLPWAYLSSHLARDFAVPFSALVKLPSIAADAALAWLIHNEAVRVGARPQRALFGASLIALGPTFVFNSAYHGQIDSLAILPAVFAVIVWGRAPEHRRAWVAGALIGAGTLIKSPAGLALLALLPSCKSRRELVVLVGSAGAVFSIPLLPFLLADSHGVARALTFKDLPGVGGLNVVLVLDLGWGSLFQALHRHGIVLVAAALLAVLPILVRRRHIAPTLGLTVLWLAFYTVSTSFFFGYLIWGIPFFILAGYIWATAGLMLLVLIPTVQFETGHIAGHLVLYEVLMTVEWVCVLLCLTVLCVRLWRWKMAPSGQVS